MTTQQTSGAQAKLARQAEHQDASGRPAAAARLYRLAAEQAMRVYDNDAAAGYLAQALTRTPDSRLGERFDLLLAREGLHALLGDQEARRTDLASLEQLADALGDDSRRAQVAVRQADYRTTIGDYDVAVSLAQLACRLAEPAGNAPLQAAACLARGLALIRQGNYVAARQELSHARALAAPAGQLEADVMRSQGLLALNCGDLPLAQSYLREALDLYRALGDRRGESTCLNNLGHIAYNGKRFTAAGRYWEEALSAYEATGDRQGRAMTLVNMGAMSMDVGEYAQARSVLEQALDLCRHIRSRYGEGLALLNLGLIHHYLGDQEQAADHSRRALALAREIDSRRLEAYALMPLGHALLAQGATVEAETAYWESLAIWHELNLPPLEAEVRAGLARTARAEQDGAGALTHVESVLATLADHATMDGTESPVRVYLTCYEILEERKDPRAGSLLARAHELLQARASEIVDEPMRQAYLDNVAAHRRIAQLVSDQA